MEHVPAIALAQSRKTLQRTQNRLLSLDPRQVRPETQVPSATKCLVMRVRSLDVVPIYCM